MKGYPSTYPTRARQLHEAGWTNCTEIARILERELGRQPGQTTIRRWVDPDYAEVVRMRQRRGGICGPKRCNTWRLRLARIRELHSLGISYAAVAAVAAHDFSIALTGNQAERMLAGELSDQSIARLLAPLPIPERSTT